MEQTNITPTGNPGKGMGIAGFVISLVALVLWFIITGIAVLAAVAGGGMGLAITWVVISLLGTVLSVMGFMKSKAAGAKKGLAIAGLVCGIVATLLSVRTVFAVKTVHETAGDVGKELMEKMGEGFKEGMQQAMDSLQSHMDDVAPIDTTSH
jgi:hypothetical protein